MDRQFMTSLLKRMANNTNNRIHRPRRNNMFEYEGISQDSLEEIKLIVHIDLLIDAGFAKPVSGSSDVRITYQGFEFLDSQAKESPNAAFLRGIRENKDK